MGEREAIKGGDTYSAFGNVEMIEHQERGEIAEVCSSNGAPDACARTLWVPNTCCGQRLPPRWGIGKRADLGSFYSQDLLDNATRRIGKGHCSDNRVSSQCEGEIRNERRLYTPRRPEAFSADYRGTLDL